MMKIWISILACLFFLFGCKKQEKKIKEKHELVTTFPKIVNSSNIKYVSTFEEENPSWISTADYNFYYLGKLKDSISLHAMSFKFVDFPKNSKTKSKTEKNEHPYKKYIIEWDAKNRFEFDPMPKIEIQVDTSVKLTNAYPVLLRNNNSDTIQIGYGGRIPLILEAKDKSGKWKPIQERFVFVCGNGVESELLPPKEIAMTLVPTFKGKYKTQLRLNLGENKSNTFWGNINYQQFESKFDENGNYKKSYEITTKR